MACRRSRFPLTACALAAVVAGAAWRAEASLGTTTGASDSFVRLAMLRASDAQPGFFGYHAGSAVAIDGDTIAVGAPDAGIGTGGPEGAVYVFTKPAPGWSDATEVAKLTATDGGPSDQLGASVAISGDTIVAGAPGAAVSGQNHRGAVYVFTKPPGGWATATQTAKLTASDGATADDLGRSVAISGDTVAAGAPGAAVGANPGQGAAYVFVRPGPGWQHAPPEAAKLTASDGARYDGLGGSMAITGGTLVVSGGDAEYVFAEPPAGWAGHAGQRAKLAAAGQALGAVAIDGSVIAAGAIGANDGFGAVNVFAEPPSGWADAQPTATLTTSDGRTGDGFGFSVAVRGATVIAGAPYASPAATFEAGAVYVFRQPSSGWASETQSQELSDPVPALGDLFGTAVADANGILVVGSPLTTLGQVQQGVAYVFADGLTPPVPAPTPGPGSGPGADSTVPAGYALGRATPPAGSLPPPSRPSARVTTIDSLLLANPRRHTIHLELRCAAPAGITCFVRGVLSVVVARRRVVIGSFTTRIPGQRISAVVINMISNLGRLDGRTAPGRLTLQGSGPRLVPVAVTVPERVAEPAAGRPPAIMTGQASGVTPPDLSGTGAPARAVLAGIINPQGLSTRYHFELGLGAGAYAVTLPVREGAAGSDHVAHLVTVTATGLLGGVTYHYRLVAENAGGVSYGRDRSFAVPLTGPPFLGPPVGDVTAAGPVALALSYACSPNPGPIVTGSTIHCLLQATNPQPAVAPTAAGPVVVRPASVVLDALAPPGTLVSGAMAPDAPIPLTVAPGTTAVSAADFTVEHPLSPIVFTVLQAGGPPATAMLTAAVAAVHLSVGCTRSPAGAGQATSLVCTVTSTNTGDDAADFGRFELSASPALVDPQSVAGGPPVVLSGQLEPLTARSQMTVRFRVRPGESPATRVSVRVDATGWAETDRLPFSAGASSQPVSLGG